MGDSAEARTSPVKTKAVLVDPVTMTVVWMNEAAAQGFEGRTSDAEVPVEHVVPAADPASLREVLAEVARTGEASHVRASMVSTSRGGLAMVTSLYPLPDGRVLALTDTAWQAPTPADGPGASRRRPRKR